MIITKRLTLECSGSSNVSSTYLAFSLHTFPTLGDVRLLYSVFVVCTLHFSSPSSSRFPCLSFSRYSKTFQNHHTFLLFFFVLSLSRSVQKLNVFSVLCTPLRAPFFTPTFYISHTPRLSSPFSPFSTSSSFVLLTYLLTFCSSCVLLGSSGRGTYSAGSITFGMGLISVPSSFSMR